ncbi:hypothetical protein BDW75DRAFT_243915 [Aspergillus navahoensis]
MSGKATGSTHRAKMMFNVPWAGAYPWGQAGGASARKPSGDVFQAHINPNIKNPDSAGDAWRTFEMHLPLKCYSYSWDKSPPARLMVE